MRNKRTKRAESQYGTNPLRGLFSVHYNDVADSRSFQAMRPLAQLLFMKSKRFYRRDLQGPIGMSARIAASLVRCSKNMGLSLCKEIVHHGFWRKHTTGHLGGFGKGIATTYQLTDEMFKGEPATLDFLKWDGEPFHEQKSPSYYLRLDRERARLKALRECKKTESRLSAQDSSAQTVSRRKTPLSLGARQNGQNPSNDLSLGARHSKKFSQSTAYPLGGEGEPAAPEQGSPSAEQAVPAPGHNAGPADGDLRGMPADLNFKI